MSKIQDETRLSIIKWECPICGARLQRPSATLRENEVIIIVTCECGDFRIFKSILLSEMVEE